MSITLKNLGTVSKSSFHEGVGIWVAGGMVETKLKATGGGFRKAAQFFFGKSRRNADGKIIPTPIVETIGVSHLPWASGTVTINDTFPMEQILVERQPVTLLYVKIKMFQVDLKGYKDSDTDTANLLRETNGLCIGSPATDKETGKVIYSRYDANVMIRKTVLVRVPILTANLREFKVKDGDLLSLSMVADTDEPGVISVEHIKPIESQFGPRSQTKKPKGKEITARKARKAKFVETEDGMKVVVGPETVKSVTL